MISRPFNRKQIHRHQGLRQGILALLGGALIMAMAACSGSPDEQQAPDPDAPRYSIKVLPVVHGDLEVSPRIDPLENYARGSRFQLTARPNEGYVLDSLYYAVDGQWGPMYFESMSGELELSLSADSEVGALFLPEEELAGLRVIQDVVYARPGVKPLKYDVFSPHTADNLPVVIIVHGGGWSSNDENIMRGMAREIARSGRYIAASIDYRWIGNLDGDEKPNTVSDLIEDVYGAIAHIIEHARDYGGDPSRIAITGDSAGGHLSAAAATMIERLGQATASGPALEPSYLPPGSTVAELRSALAASLKAAAPSYGVFAAADLGGRNQGNSADTQAIAPQSNIPPAGQRHIPHFMVRGTADPLISEAMVAGYARALRDAGHEVQHIEVPGAGHAFYDWKPDNGTRRVFNEIGVPHIQQMIEFFDRYVK